MTLEPGDVILTRTAAGASVVVPVNVVEVRLGGAGSVTSTIVEGAAELAPYGAMPRATADARALPGANPPPPSRPPRRGPWFSATTRWPRSARYRRPPDGAADPARIETTFLSGLRPTRSDLPMVGYARTLRYVAVRADVREAMKGAEDAQKRAVSRCPRATS